MPSFINRTETEGARSPHRILVIANETVEGRRIHDEVLSRSESGEQIEVLVVCPALNSRWRHWFSDEDAAREAAAGRLESALSRLEGEGITAKGWVGDANPLQSIADGLRVFAADEVIVATHPEGQSNWLEADLIGRARELFSVPIIHVVVTVDALVPA